MEGKYNLIVAEYSEDFFCKICRDIARDPLQCKRCDILFCNSCFDSMTLKRCP